MKRFLQKLFGLSNEPHAPSVKNIWVGTFELVWIRGEGKDREEVGRTIVNLFENEKGKRTFTAAGLYVEYDTWKSHKYYGRFIVPFVSGCNLDYIYKELYAYNIDYWREKGYDVSSQVKSPNNYYKNKKPKPKDTDETETNVISFPKDAS